MGPEQNYGYQVPNYNMQPQSPKRMVKKIIFIIIAAFLALSVVAFILVLIFSSPSSRVDVSRIQGNYIEIGRVSELAIESDRARRTTRNAAASLQLVSISNQTALEAFADNKYGSGLKDSLFSESTNEQYDQELASAAQQNTYDDAFARIMGGLLEDTNSKIAKVLSDYPGDEDLARALTPLAEGNEVTLNALN